MTTPAPVATLPSLRASDDLGQTRITAWNLLRSEWAKLWSVPSLWVTFLVAFAVILGPCAYLIFDGTLLNSEDMRDTPFGWTGIYQLGMLVLVVTGILSITNEYGNRSIQLSMVAAPRRTGVLLAKATVLTGVTAIAGVITSLVLYTLLQIAGTVPAASGLSLFDSDMFWGVLGGTLVLPYGALLGLLIGGLVRNAAAAICLYVGFFQFGPDIFPAFLPESLAAFVDYMPLEALEVMRSGGAATEPYGTAISIIVLLSWLAATGGVTWWLLKRRDV